MDRDILVHLPIVVKVAELKGFAAAASAMNMSASAVSHAVRLVEDRLGEPLFARTTRSVSLTEAGERLITRLAPAIANIEGAFEAVASDRGEVTGTLRLNLPRVALPMGVTEVITALTLKHPRLTVELHTNDAFVDIVAEGFDAGIRLGEAIHQDMVMVRLTPPFSAIMVASPDYIARMGTPGSLGDLHGHRCIGIRHIGSRRLYEWDVVDSGVQTTVDTPNQIVITDPSFARDFALAGAGIGYIFEPLVEEDIRRGHLQQILPESAIEEDGLFLYYPQRASLAPKLRAFIDEARIKGKRLAA